MSMRVTNNMLANSFLVGYNNSLQKQYTLSQQLSSGQANLSPADDPTAAVLSLQYNSSLVQNQQYTQNSQTALSWMSTTDSTMQSLSSLMNQVQSLVVEGSNDNQDSTALTAIGQQIKGLVSQAVSLGNTQIGSRYIFGGQQDSSQPLTLENEGQSDEAVVYNGDNNKISMPIGPGKLDPAVDGINLTGAQVFGPVVNVGGQATLSVFNHLIAIQNQLLHGTPAQSNAQGGAATVSGTYAGTGTQEFMVQVAPGGVTNGQVTQANYSSDGGKTWTAAATSAGVVTLPGGISLNIATNNSTAANDTYTFAVAAGAGAVTDVNWLTNTGLGYLQSDQTMQQNSEAELGARESAYQMGQTLLANANTTINTNISNTDDVDMAVASTNYSNAKTAYQAALQVGAELIPKSLVDFLGSG